MTTPVPDKMDGNAEGPSSPAPISDGKDAAKDVETIADLDDIAEPSREGQVIGPYRLVRLLGQGGMGSVYAAIHQKIGQQIAVKLLSANLSRRASARRRFLNEAQAGAAVRHPGLVQIFDHGTLPDGTPYILMEFLEGQLLRAHLAQLADGKAPLRTVVRIGRQVAAALAAAHAKGVIHRDLKPDNLMLVPEPEAPGGRRVKVLDFGIAKFLRAPDYRTQPSARPLGTPTYMSPEQCRGDEQRDGQTDVYSLGISLYEMLCGRPPFGADPQEQGRVTFQHVFADPQPPRMLRPDLPQPLEALVLRTLSKDPKKRPDMAEVERILEGLDTNTLEFVGKKFAIRRYVPTVVMILALFLGISIYWKPRSSLAPPASVLQNMVLVSGAQFRMGTDAELAAATGNWARNMMGCKACTDDLYLRETPSRTVNVDSFYMDVDEVTNQDFAGWLWDQRDVTESRGIIVDEPQRCPGGQNTCEAKTTHEIIAVNVGDLRVIELDLDSNRLYLTRGLDWSQGRVKVTPGMEQKPVVNLTWGGANYYCRSKQKRLPTEAEWELAARGKEGRQFPWGNEPPRCGELTLGWRNNCNIVPRGPAEVGTSRRDTTPIGIHDLGGNVAEWVTDYFRLRYPPCEGNCIVTTDSTDSREAGRRVVRGGSWSNEPDASRSASRSRWRQNGTAGDIGFRCARTLNPSK